MRTFIIAASGKPAARLVVNKPQRYRMGGMEEQFTSPPDSFFYPLNDEELTDWE